MIKMRSDEIISLDWNKTISDPEIDSIPTNLKKTILLTSKSMPLSCPLCLSVYVLLCTSNTTLHSAAIFHLIVSLSDHSDLFRGLTDDVKVRNLLVLRECVFCVCVCSDCTEQGRRRISVSAFYWNRIDCNVSDWRRCRHHLLHHYFHIQVSRYSTVERGSQ